MGTAESDLRVVDGESMVDERATAFNLAVAQWLYVSSVIPVLQNRAPDQGGGRWGATGEDMSLEFGESGYTANCHYQ